MARGPLLRSELQSNADGKGFNFFNLNAVGYTRSATLIVDPSLAVDPDVPEIGVRGTNVPFRTLAAAVAAALPGDVIILRPGIHAYDGVQDIFHLTGLRIVGYGAIITSQSETNETIKMTIRSDGVTIEGIEFDGGFTAPSSGSGDGCIEVTETDVAIINCWFHDQDGFGVHLPVHYDGARILGNRFQNCAAGVFAEADTGTSVDTESIWINDNIVQHNRSFGIGITGPGPDSGKFITGIQINDNEFSGNDTDAGHVPAIALSFSCQGIQIRGNVITDESSGISLDKCKDAVVSGNTLKGINSTGIALTGCIGAKLGDNLLDGRNSAGVASTSAPIVISGFYAVANDAGQINITGNQLIFLKTNSVAVAVSNATGITLNSNRIENTISFTACVSVMVNGNQLQIPVTTQGILIDGGNRASSKFSIIGNRFNFTGASINRAITTVDASGVGVTDILIEGNSAPFGQTFGIAAYGHSGSNAASNVVVIGNTPEAEVATTTGWLNVGSNANILRVYVSQSRGNDSTGRRQSRTNKFRTINAAMTAASSGDVIIVEDGTFDERIDGKAGLFTIRFLEPAILLCSTAGGCIRSTAVNQFLTIYHQHAAIQNSQTNVPAVSWTHAGGVLTLYCPVYNSGTGSSAILCQDGNVECFGSVISSAGEGIRLQTGTPVVHVHGGIASYSTAGDVVSGGTSVAVSAQAGEFIATNAKLFGAAAAVDLNCDDATAIRFKQCTLVANTAASPAIAVTNPGAVVPLLRDCVLVAGGSATQAIIAASAQTITLYGQTVANKGSDPPTNVTFNGGGTYDVSSSVIAD